MQTANKSMIRQGQAGVGLIEVLIAVLVLSIGFLGIAALQAKALSNNNSAMARTQASIAAYSMFDAMRADRTAALNGNYNGTITATAGACPTATTTLADVQKRIWCLGFDPSNPPKPLSGSTAYSVGSPPPPSLLGGLAALGTGSTGAIACNPFGAGTAASNCKITITFNDSKASGGNAAQQMIFWTQL